jgi:thiol:disulfide interchange protein DsbD
MNRLCRPWAVAGLLTLAPLVSGAGWPPAATAPSFLPVAQAFPFSYAWEGQQLQLRWNTAEGYALYKSRLRIEPADAVTWTIKGHEETDPDAEPDFRSKYVGPLEITVAVAAGKGPQQLIVTYQGCSLHGLCYPPQRAVLQRH